MSLLLTYFYYIMLKLDYLCSVKSENKIKTQKAFSMCHHIQYYLSRGTFSFPSSTVI